MTDLIAFSHDWAARQQAYADYELRRFEKFLEETEND